MAAVNPILELAIASPYEWLSNDCLSLVEAVHGVRRPDWMHAPEAAVRERAIETCGGVPEGYEAALSQMGFLPGPGDDDPGVVAVIVLPRPLDATVGIYDDARTVRYRVGDRLLPMQPGHRLRSAWILRRWREG